MLRGKRFVFASLFMLFFLPLASDFDSNLNSIGPFGSVAIAGHSHPSGFACECGCPDCICYPQEQPNCGHGVKAHTSPSENPDEPESPFDPGAGTMILAFLFLLWARFRT
jgi:hypothetical protein